MVRGFESGMAKIIRAMGHHKPIEDCIAKYASRKPYKQAPQSNGPPILEITEQPPIDISILAGEVIYQLRSALDHFFFDLIERNGPPLTPKQIRGCYFPLKTKRPIDTLGPIWKTDLLEDYQLRMPHDAFALIEALQPYNQLHEGHRLLCMLTKFSNIDKHRHLTSTILRIDRKHTVTTTTGIRSTVIMPMLDTGAELYEPLHYYLEADSAVATEDEYSIAVAFDEPEFGPPQTALLDDLIHELPTFIFRIGIHLRQFLT